MEARRRPTGYIIAVVVVLILSGWLMTRYVTKRRLLRALGDRNVQVRVPAAKKLLEMRKLSESLPGQPIIVRSKTAEALGEIGTDDALKVLGELIRDQEEAPRRWARDALIKQGMRAMPVLMSALSAGGGTKDEAVRALKALGPQTTDDLRFLLSDRGPYNGAADALSRLGPRGVAPLVQASYQDDLDLRRAALSSMGLQKVKAAVVPAIFNLTDKKEDKKGSALKALGFIGDRRATLPLIPFLQTGDREKAVTSLGLIGDPRAVEPILSTMTITEMRYRNAAIIALRRIGAPAFPALVRELGSPQPLMREAAAASLIGSKSSSVNGPLMAAVKDTDPEVRASAASALGWTGNVAAVPSLVVALSDKRWPVVDASVGALGAIGVSAADPLLAVLRKPGEDLTVSYQVARALAAMGRPALPKLVAALAETNPGVQKWSAIALGEIGDPKAVRALQELESIAEPDLRWVVQEQLRRITGVSG